MKYFGIQSETSFRKEVIADLLASIGETDEDPLDYIAEECRISVKALLEEVMRAELDLHIGFEPYGRGAGRADSRNGYYERDLESVFGLLEDLKIPRSRSGTFRTKLIERYQRRQKKVGRFIREMFVRGISTRRIGEVLTPLLGIEPSASTISRIAKTLDAEVKKYRTRPIVDEFIYLMFDAVTMKVKEAPQARKVVVLCAYGITKQGHRVLIGFQVARAESEGCWQAFLEDLFRRGLYGGSLELIVTDGNAGLIRAVEMIYGGVPRQRCWAHKGRNVAATLHKKNEEECLSGMKRIYNQANRRMAIRAYREWEHRWENEEPNAVKCVAKDLEELLAFYQTPEAHWKKVRTTNLIERIFREVRRRTTPMTCFANKASCDRVIFAVFDSFNKRWESRPIRHFTQKG